MFGDNRIALPGWLLVCGSGRNVGKTWLAESVLRSCSATTGLAALKISPHRHYTGTGQVPVAGNEGFRLFREHLVSEHDSGRFLAAGASLSYYLECDDDAVADGVRAFLELTGHDRMVICESGRLGRIFKPNLMLFIEGEHTVMNEHKQTLADMSDMIIRGKEDLPAVAERIRVIAGSWELI